MKKLVRFFAVATMIGGLAFADQINLNFVNSSITTTGNTTVIFQATAMNPEGVTENLNSAQITSLGSPLSTDLNDYFFTTWPFSLDPGQSFGPAAIFSVTVPDGTPTGDYTGTLDILGGPGINDLAVLASVNFDVNVAVPEPGSATLAMVGIGLGFALRAARQARRRNA
ncbi:MAG TPA: PEP-CTERM sorting domain-containing protein [Bryobacteraceae bacterium]